MLTLSRTLLFLSCILSSNFLFATEESNLSSPKMLLGYTWGQFADRLDDQSTVGKHMDTYFLGVETQAWRTLFEVYTKKQMTGNATLSVTSMQSHFDLSVARKFESLFYQKAYAGFALKLFRLDTDTRVGASARSDSSNLLYSGGVLFGVDVIDTSVFWLAVEVRAFKHERFDPDPQPQGLLRFSLKL